MSAAPDSPDKQEKDLHRLHPLSLLFSLGGVARSFLLPALLVLFSSGAKGELFFAALFLPGAVYAVLHYLTFSYRFGEDELIVRGGIIVRYERHVPYPRIQNVDLVQNLFHRLFKVAQVSIETASGKEPEAVMKVLGLEAVDDLRTRVYAERGPSTPVDTEIAPDAAVSEESDTERAPSSTSTAIGNLPGVSLFRLPTRELLLMGALSNRGFAIVAAAWGLFVQTDMAQDGLTRTVIQFAKRHATVGDDTLDRLSSESLSTQIALGGAGLLAFLLTLKLLSVVWVFVRFHGFRLERAGEDLRVSFGLLTRLSATVPRRRIQVLGVHAGPIQRRLDRVTLRAQTAGSAEDDNQAAASARSYLAPLIRRDACRALLEEVQPGVLDVERDPDWRPAEFRGWRRLVKIRILTAIVLTVLLSLWLEAWALLVLPPFVAFAVVSARGAMRRRAYAVEPNALLLRKGWWRHELGIIPHSRIQSVSVTSSPFDRRWGMATLLVDTAGSGGARVRTTIRYLATDDAERLREKLHAEAVARPFVWS